MNRKTGATKKRGALPQRDEESNQPPVKRLRPSGATNELSVVNGEDPSSPKPPQGKLEGYVPTYHTNGALETTNVVCQGGCGFNGAMSGLCSLCWNALSPAQKKKATTEQELLEPIRRASLIPAPVLLFASEREINLAQESQQAQAIEEAAFLTHRQQLIDQGRPYPLNDTDQDPKLAALEQMGFKETLALWTCGLYRKSLGTPSNAAIGEPSADYQRNWETLSLQLQKLFGSIKGRETVIPSERSRKKPPRRFNVPLHVFCLPVETSAVLRDQPVRDIVESIFQFSSRANAFEYSDETRLLTLTGMMSNQTKFLEAFTSLRALAQEGSLCIGFPTAIGVGGPCFIAGRDHQFGIVFIIITRFCPNFYR